MKKKILNWYKNNQRADDVIISASPSFLLKEICNRLEIKILIASRVNYKTGKFIGLNCYGDEKVRRFIECFPDENIDEFYTDSRADKPLAVLARKAYLIKNGEKTIWNF